MQTLSRLRIRGRGRIRAATAWLAIAAVLGSMPLAAPARASCAARVSGSARACALCHPAAPAAPSAASRAFARPPCCGCEIGSEALPSAPPAGLSLERPASQWQGAAVSVATPGAFAPLRSPHFYACGPPDTPPQAHLTTTILRI